MSRLPAVHSSPESPTWNSGENAAAIRADCAKTTALPARLFWQSRSELGKTCDSAVEVLHVTFTPPTHDRQRNQRKIPTRGTWTVPYGGADGGLHGFHVQVKHHGCLLHSNVGHFLEPYPNVMSAAGTNALDTITLRGLQLISPASVRDHIGQEPDIEATEKQLRLFAGLAATEAIRKMVQSGDFENASKKATSLLESKSEAPSVRLLGGQSLVQIYYVQLRRSGAPDATMNAAKVKLGIASKMLQISRDKACETRMKRFVCIYAVRHWRHLTPGKYDGGTLTRLHRFSPVFRARGGAVYFFTTTRVVWMLTCSLPVELWIWSLMAAMNWRRFMVITAASASRE